MKITRCRWAKINLERPRLIVALQSETGDEVYSEISPYPSLNKESLDDAFNQLKNLPLHDTDTPLPDLFPSVAFAIRAAFAQLTDPLPAFSCPFSALFQGTISQIYRQAQRAQELGITSAKLKLGFFSLSEAQELIAQLKPLFRLRLDLNHLWSAKEVFRFFSAYAPSDFDYIEDPLKDPVKLLQFLLPFAIDAKEESAPNLPMKTLVVKPTILKTIPVSKAPIVLSSCFDTGLNIFHLAALAKRRRLGLPQGLGPYLFLNQDILEHSFPIKNGQIHVPATLTLQKPLYAALSDL